MTVHSAFWHGIKAKKKNSVNRALFIKFLIGHK